MGSGGGRGGGDSKTINNSPQLIAYYVAGAEAAPKWRNQKSTDGKLPDYMVPGVIVGLEALPLTPNGKVDRKWLASQEVEAGKKSGEYVAPQTEMEKKLCRIWEEVLGVERVGVEDDFFQMGGHSLLATQIMSRVEKQTGVKLPLREMFQYPKLREMAEGIRKREAAAEGEVEGMSGVERPQELPLSYAQERLWFLGQLGYSEHYHVPQVMRVVGALREEALQQAVNYVVERHESLRTRFVSEQGRAWQEIEGRVDVRIAKRDMRGWGKRSRRGKWGGRWRG